MQESIQFIIDSPFMQRAMISGALIGFANGFFSGFVNLRRQSLSVSALSHTMLPGIALAILITGTLSQTNAFIGALFAALMVGLGAVAVGRSSRIPQSTALAIFYTSAFAAGVAALPYLPVQTELQHWLFGNILTVSDQDLTIVFIISAITLITSNLFMRPLLLTLFEPNVAAAQGAPVKAMQYLLFSMLILMLVASLQSVGCVLSVGLLVGPAAIVILFTNNTQALFWCGGLIGALSSVLGIFLSQLIGISSGPAIVIILGLLFFIAFLISPRYGLLARNKQSPHSHTS